MTNNATDESLYAPKEAEGQERDIEKEEGKKGRERRERRVRETLLPRETNQSSKSA